MARNVPVNDTDQLPSYIVRLTKVPLLTPEQERDITLRVSQGDCEAKQKLIEANMRLVVNIARSYRSRNIPLEDLIQEGIIGLMQAAERFDPGRELRFSTYATHWIRQAIGRAIDNKSKSIRLPAHVAQSIRKIEREKLRLSCELGHEPTAEQLAGAMGLSTMRLLNLLQASRDMLSLDMSVGDGAGTTLAGLLPDHGGRDPESVFLTKETHQELRRILSELNEREQRVVKLRYSLDTAEEPAMQDDVAKQLQLSRERVRQIEMKAMKRLRTLAHRRRLREMLG